MKAAYIWLPKDLRPIAETGIALMGYEVRDYKDWQDAKPGDVFLSWTLYDASKRRRISDAIAERGIATLCFERGWLRGKGHWQIAWRVGNGTGFNGHGRFVAGGPERWANMGFDLKPWRADGRHILICGNKGRAYDGKLSKDINHDDDWPDYIIGKIRLRTDRPIWYRPHPKPGPGRCVPRVNLPDRLIDTDAESLEQSLAGAWCTVVYASSAASTSIIEGVPVIYTGPKIMAYELAAAKLLYIPSPITPERLPVLERLAWAQWLPREIENGTAFMHLGL